MQGRGAHAWCLQGKDAKGGIEGAGPVDGDPNRMSSYRAELHGVAAILLALKLILALHESYRPLAGYLELFCDNKAVIQFGNQKPRVWSVSAANAPEFDILNTVRELLIEIHIQVRFKWVKGHQSTLPMPREAHLNKEMDEKAREFVTSTSTGLQPQRSAFHIQRGKISFISKGQRNTTHLREQIYNHRTENKLRCFILEKTGWDENTFLMVDLESLGKALRNLTETEKIARVKYMHNWWHHGRQQKLMGVMTTSENGLCPLCLEEEETTDHILRCKSDQGKSNRSKAWRTLVTVLKEEKTAPLITCALNECVDSWTENRERAWRSEYTDTHSQQVSKAVQAQATIGWDQFLRGRIAREWKSAQKKYLKETGSPAKYTAESWGKKTDKSDLELRDRKEPSDLWRKRS